MVRIWDFQDLFRGITDLRAGIPDVEEALSIIELESNRKIFDKKTLCFCVPRLSTPKTTSSPPFKKCGGDIFSPTPGGVPVQQISPGCKLIQELI